MFFVGGKTESSTKPNEKPEDSDIVHCVMFSNKVLNTGHKRDKGEESTAKYIPRRTQRFL